MVQVGDARLPLAVEAANVRERRLAAQRQAGAGRKLGGDRRHLRLPVDVVVGVDVRRWSAHQLSEGSELARQLAAHRSRVAEIAAVDI